MKTRMSKNTVIVALLIATVLSGAYLLAKEAGLLSGKMREAAAQSKDEMDRMPLRKKGVLLEAGLGREDELQACYQSFLKREPNVDEGVVEVHWMLDKRGKISSMEMVHSDLGDEDFNRCLLDKIKKMTFKAPPKAKPTLVAHKFNFHKRSPASLDFKQALRNGNKDSDEE
jgi:hypothetical protein